MVVLHMASLVWHTKVILNGLPAALFAILAGMAESSGGCATLE